MLRNSQVLLKFRSRGPSTFVCIYSNGLFLFLKSKNIHVQWIEFGLKWKRKPTKMELSRRKIQCTNMLFRTESLFSVLTSYSADADHQRLFVFTSSYFFCFEQYFFFNRRGLIFV